MKIYLADLSKELCDAWHIEARKSSLFTPEIIHGSIFDSHANTIVSPANSFGYMTGGIDLAISEYLGWEVQEKVQNVIKHQFSGELLVGQACHVNTGHDRFQFLICAPTMRVPSILENSINPYLATRATLNELSVMMRKYGLIPNPVFTGMGTGTGKVPADVCARQMFEAMNEWYEGVFNFPESLREETLRQRSLER